MSSLQAFSIANLAATSLSLAASTFLSVSLELVVVCTLQMLTTFFSCPCTERAILSLAVAAFFLASSNITFAD